MGSNSSVWKHFLRRTLWQYSISLAATIAALFLRTLLNPVMGDYTPYITLYPTIVLVSLYVGMGPAVVAVILGTLGVTYWVVGGSFHVLAQLVGGLGFIMVAACIIAASEVSRRSLKRLRRTKTLFETFLDNSPGVEFMKDEFGRYVYLNKTGRSLFALDFIGKTDAELFPASFASQWRANDLLVLEQGKAKEFIETSPHPDGERTWLDVKFPVIDADGRSLLGGKAIDITQMKRAEKEIVTFLEAAPAGLTRCSRDQRYLAANSAFAEIAGLSLDNIVGRPIIDVLGSDVWEAIRPYVERVLRGERVEYETLLPYGSVGHRDLHVVYTPEKHDGEVVGWVAAITDITRLKCLETQLREVEKRAAAGQLAAALAHEINNPLSAVINILYLLKGHSGLDPTLEGLISSASNEIARVARIVGQSLSYYRAGAAAKDVDLAALIDESFQVFGDKLQRAGISISKKIAPGTSISGFADEIRQVVDNLLINAVEATPPGGRLTLCLRKSRSWKNRDELGVRLTIGDNGDGIAKVYLSRVFDPFFTTKGEHGNGLGLWVVKGIVEKHCGSIKIRSTDAAPKTGTVISIFWPKNAPARKLVTSKDAA